MPTLLELVQNCDNVSQPDGVPFALTADGPHLGCVHPNLAPFISSLDHADLLVFSSAQNVIHFAPSVARTAEARSDAMRQFLESLRTNGDALSKLSALQGWRNELYPIYGTDGEPAFLIERCATPLFAFRTYGVHLNGYIRDASSGEIKMWVGRRSATKPTWPNMLDNIVGGGIAHHDGGVFKTLVKECSEEASIPSSLLADAKRTSMPVTYFVRNHLGQSPETQYIYDLEMPSDFEPRGEDGEVQGFMLMNVKELLESLRSGEWKPNCAAITIEFLVRNQFISEQDLEEGTTFEMLKKHLHRKLDYFNPATKYTL